MSTNLLESMCTLTILSVSFPIVASAVLTVLPVRSEKSCLSQIAIGAGRACLVVYLGTLCLFFFFFLTGLLLLSDSFGLLHRIPPQSPDHHLELPIELQEPVEEYEQQELFVPADAESEMQVSSEQLAEWRRQEQEQWNRENLARTMYERSDSRQHPTEGLEPIDPHGHVSPEGHTSSTGQITPRRTHSLLAGPTPTRAPIVSLMNGDSSS